MLSIGVYWRPSIPLSCWCARRRFAESTTAEGLAHNSVHRIVADSRGFLWLATNESRFDGYQFITYDAEQGPPHRAVYDLVETQQGAYWLATPAGLCRFDPRSKPAFHAYAPTGPPGSRWINTILQGREGRTVACEVLICRCVAGREPFTFNIDAGN